MSPMPLTPRDRMIVALDLPTVAAAEAMVERLGEAADFYKIGYQLVFSGGLELARDLAAAGKQVFLDVKLHDIGNTIEHAVENIARLGMRFVTVHAYPQTMAAAVRGRSNAPLRILGVTVLTSYDETDLAEAGYSGTVAGLVAKRAAQAAEIGIDGLVCSPMEVATVRGIVGDKMALVTPGVRPAGAAKGDQKRVMTPADALTAGADHLVIGRPIVAAPDPRAAAEAILQEIAAATA